MKVQILAADKGGCGFYRCVEPARVARDLDVDVEVIYGLDVEARESISTKMVEVTEVHSDADLLVVQRPLSNALTSMIEQAQRQGIATIVEIDDDFDNTSKRNIAYKYMHEGDHSGAHWVRKATSLADLVTVSTPALEKYAPHGRSEVLRNCVPQSLVDCFPVYERRDPEALLSVGWTGTTQTHPNDLQVTKGSINDVLTEYNAGFNVVGDGKNVQKFLRLDSTIPFDYTGWTELDMYYSDLVLYLDIGIVPLELSNFNQAKSTLKGLEMAALGIPFVASPTREYLRLEAYGVGKTAKAPGDWRRHLGRWLRDPERSVKDAKKYRGIIEENFTYELNAQSWINAWQRAIDYRKTQL